MVYTERKCKHHASGGFEPSTSLLSGNSAKHHISVQLQQQYQYDVMITSLGIIFQDMQIWQMIYKIQSYHINT